MARKKENNVKLPRNWNAVDAKFRKAGSMKHKNEPRQGSKDTLEEMLLSVNAEYGSDVTGSVNFSED